jgi:uncharacterized protein (TIGR00255 family)
MTTVTSMTGYARAEGRCAVDGLPVPFTWVWEAKSVNGRGLDIRVRAPAGFDSLEPMVRQAAAEVLARGSLTINLQVTPDTTAAGPKLNEPLLDAAIALAVRTAAGLPSHVLGTTIAPARLDGLLALRGVLDSPDLVVIEPAVITARDREMMAGAVTALQRLNGSRRAEGARLAPVVGGHLEEIAKLCADARVTAAAQPAAIQARIAQGAADLLGAIPALSPERLAQEAALLALKADVREELDRLEAHVAQARELLAKGEPCGRKLEFLSQEFNREVNTLCSKSTDLTLTRTGLALKAVVDQFREQIQNIE